MTFACGAGLAGSWLGALAATRAAWLLRAVHASLGSGSARSLLLTQRRGSCVHVETQDMLLIDDNSGGGLSCCL